MLRRQIAFALWRAATAMDTEYMLLVAKTLTRIATARERQACATVPVEIARPLAERLNDWSEPVQVQFRESTDGWVMYIRSCEQQVAISEAIRARAERQ
jgi:hypothetical protein